MNLNLLGFAPLCFRGPWLQALGAEGLLYFPSTFSEQLSGLFWCSCTLPSLGMALRLSEIPAKNNWRASAAENRKPQEHEGRQQRPRNLLIKHCYGCEALPTGVARAASNFSPFPFPVAIPCSCQHHACCPRSAWGC